KSTARSWWERMQPLTTGRKANILSPRGLSLRPLRECPRTKGHSYTQSAYQLPHNLVYFAGSFPQAQEERHCEGLSNLSYPLRSAFSLYPCCSPFIRSRWSAAIFAEILPATPPSSRKIFRKAWSRRVRR